VSRDDAVGDEEADSSSGPDDADNRLAPIPGRESQSLRKPGPSMVALEISISGHGPAVKTVHVPHVPPMSRKKISR